MNYILTLLAQVCAISAMGYLWLGHQYLTVNHGLHPMIAGAAALSMLILPYCFARWVREREEIKRDTIRNDIETTTADWRRLHK